MVYNLSFLLTKWRFLLFLIHNYLLIDSVLVPTFHSYYSISMTTLLPLNIICLILLFLDLLLKLSLTPHPPTNASLRKRITLHLTYDLFLLDLLTYFIFLISFIGAQSYSVYLRLVIVCKIKDVVHFNDTIYQKLHTNPFLRQCYTIVKMIYIMFLFSHYSGCLFYALDNHLMNVEAFGPPNLNPQNYYMMQSLTFTPIQALPDLEKYLYALYFTIALITTIAYGDIVGKNYIEDAYVLCLLFISTITVALILQQFMILMKKTQFALHQIIMQFNVMKAMMQEKQVPIQLQTHIRNYLFYTQYQNTLTSHQAILDKLPNKLQLQLKYQGYSQYIVPHFNHVEEMCALVDVVSYQANNTVPQGVVEGALTADLYIVIEGEAHQYIQCGEQNIAHYIQYNNIIKDMVFYNLDSSIIPKSKVKECFNKREFLTDTLPNYSLKTNNLTKFIKIKHSKYQEYLKSNAQLHYKMKNKKQKALLKEECIECNSITHYHHCSLCGECDHSVETCPDVHYTIDQKCNRGQKISNILWYNRKRRHFIRKNYKQSKINKMFHLSMIMQTMNQIINREQQIRKQYINHLRNQYQSVNSLQKQREYVHDSVYDERE